MNTKYKALIAGLAIIGLSGCASVAEDLGKAGAFDRQPVQCTDASGNTYTGSAEACMVLAQAEVENARTLAISSSCDGIAAPSGNSGADAWQEYYRSCREMRGDVAMAQVAFGSGGGSKYPQQSADKNAFLAGKAIDAQSRRETAFIAGGFNLATFGVASVADIVRESEFTKRQKAQWAAFSRPNISVGGRGGKASSDGEGSASSTSGDTIVAVDSAVGIEGSRVSNNRDGFQATAYDDGTAIAARAVTDPTQVSGACDDGDSLCDGEAPFVQQNNPTEVDTGLFGGGQ